MGRRRSENPHPFTVTGYIDCAMLDQITMWLNRKNITMSLFVRYALQMYIDHLKREETKEAVNAVHRDRQADNSQA
jgi:hypothetical protein